MPPGRLVWGPVTYLVNVTLSYDAETGKDRYRVELGPWKGNGRSTQILATGEID